MMQPVITIRRDARRHRLDAFALARSDQPGYIQGAHLPPLFVAQLLNERPSANPSAPHSIPP